MRVCDNHYYSLKTTVVAMVARAGKVSATPIFMSEMVFVATATSRKSLARAGALRNTTTNIPTRRKRAWLAQLVRTL